MNHRRAAWWKHTHENLTVDVSVANTEILMSATESTTMVDVLNKWYNSEKNGTVMYSLEGGLGHGKSEILKHAVASVVQKNQNIKHAFVDADPLNTSELNQNMAGIASVLYDIFAREGRKTADQIERECLDIFKASGPTFVSLLQWLPTLNSIFPVSFTFRSDDCRSVVMKAGKSPENQELLEITQRTLLVGMFWAISNREPLLLVLDDVLDMDVKSFSVFEDLITDGSHIINAYNIVNPGVLNFLVKECVPKKKQRRKICLILSMKPFEDAQEHMDPSVSVMLRDSFNIGKSNDDVSAKSKSCQRLFVPLLDEDSTEQVFVKCMRKMFPKLKMLDDAGRKSVFKQSEGNPLFIREIADELMEVYKMDAKKIRLDKSETKLM
jgi:hypothetical protein